MKIEKIGVPKRYEVRKISQNDNVNLVDSDYLWRVYDTQKDEIAVNECMESQALGWCDQLNNHDHAVVITVSNGACEEYFNSTGNVAVIIQDNDSED